MDPESLPREERVAAAQFDCPYCFAQAGYRCRTSSGEFYNEETYVHIDRLITMYRDSYTSTADREAAWLQAGMEAALAASPDSALREGYDLGWAVGHERGWREGVLDARYTFENTPVYPGSRVEDRLAGQMEAADATEQASATEQEGAGEHEGSDDEWPDDGGRRTAPPVTLRSV